MADVYKRITFKERDSRIPRTLSSDELQKGKDILENFRTYFISKHLS